MKNRQLRLKLERLTDRLRSFDRVGVACSGGVDSTFLTYACCKALGMDKVVVLFADSALLSTDLRFSVEKLLKTELGQNLRFKKICVDPFSRAGFDKNPKDRCYICKTHIYQRFLDDLETDGIDVLLDGTNCDDLREDRPGLQAIQELGIITPLVEAGFHKRDVRAAAAHCGLANAELPSNSCLATRIEPHTEINGPKLREIEMLESFLYDRGYHGCRVRPRKNTVIIEVRSGDLTRICKVTERQVIVSYFQRNGYDVVLLDMAGRSN